MSYKYSFFHANVSSHGKFCIQHNSPDPNWSTLSTNLATKLLVVKSTKSVNVFNKILQIISIFLSLNTAVKIEIWLMVHECICELYNSCLKYGQ